MKPTRQQMEADFPKCCAAARFIRDKCGFNKAKMTGATERGRYIGKTINLKAGVSPVLEFRYIKMVRKVVNIEYK